ncbi:MAG: thioredoxin-dependent thiol peroxidase [Bacteroidota bacterium]|nr:thioredoxin-dependent thiol peroxidase [Bacteroidota bacterium]
MTNLEVGDKAPDFIAKNQKGKTVRLSDFKGKKVVLYFYPKDDTPGCTAESCNLRDNYAELRAKGYEIIGISADDEDSHLRFAKKFTLPFDLLADTDKKIISDYGVWGEKNIFGNIMEGILRTTFIINEEGRIERVIKKVDTKDHTAQFLG